MRSKHLLATLSLAALGMVCCVDLMQPTERANAAPPTPAAHEHAAPLAGEQVAQAAPAGQTGAQPAAMRQGQQGQAMRYSLAFPTGNPQTSAILLESDVPQQVRVGQPFKYTLRVTNLTDAPIQGVRVADVGEPTGTALTAGGTTRPAHVDPLMWEVGALAPRQSQTKQINGVGDEVGSIHNCLTVTYSPTLCTMITVVKPELQLTKEGPERVMVCEGITYTYKVTNTGTGVAQGVRVEDQLPEGLTTANGQRTVTQDVGDLAQGQSKQFQVQVKPTHTGQYGSRATARSGDTESQSGNVTTAVVAPALAVTVDAPESRYVNEPIDYRVTVRNTGDAPSQNTVVRLAGATGDAMGDRNVGTIAPNDAKAFTLTTRAGATGGQQVVTATASGQCAQPAENKATVSIMTIPALRLGVVHTVDPVRVGNNTVYTISVANTGSGPDKNVVVSAMIPPEEQFVKGNGTTEVKNEGSNVTFGPIPQMNPGETATWNVEVKTSKAGDAVFHATLKSDSMTKAAEKVEPTRIVE